jgi:hypothetical protein
VIPKAYEFPDLSGRQSQPRVSDKYLNVLYSVFSGPIASERYPTPKVSAKAVLLVAQAVTKDNAHQIEIARTWRSLLLCLTLSLGSIRTNFHWHQT